MSLIASVNPLYVILPIVLAQYATATFVLVKLAKAQLSGGVYLVWNIVIVIVFFIGSAAFLIWNARRVKRLAKAQGDNGDSQSAQPCESRNDVGDSAESDRNGEDPIDGGSNKWNI